ncbi:AraC family transcriptional regulator [Pseudomonas aeruginosa]
MSFNPFVRALSLVGFAEFATGQGLTPADMLRRAALPQESLERYDGIIAFHRYCALLDICQRQSGNALFGLQLGLFQGVNAFGELLYLIRNAQTVGDALDELRANYALYNGAADIGFDIDGDTATLSYRVNQLDLPGLPQAEELACGVGVQLLRALLGEGWRPGAILLRHPALQDEAGYRQALGFLPRFSAHCSGLQFATSALSLPLSTADTRLHQLTVEHMKKMERLLAGDLPSYVRQLLRHLLPSGRATVEKVADCMALNTRTLQRRLTQERTSFQQLLDETRQDMACRYLEDPFISMTQMSGLLGYSNQSGFCRAFNRWFQVTPLEWQKRHCPNRQPRLLRDSRLNALQRGSEGDTP